MKWKWLRKPTELVIHSQAGERAVESDLGHLWILDLDDLDIDGVDTLSSEELVRATRFSRPQDRRRFLSSRVLIRQVLSQATGIAPQSLLLGAGACGKPFVRPAPGAPSVGFNLSHSENMLGLVVAFGREAGIDLEFVDARVDVRPLGLTFFNEAELRELRKAGDPIRAFYLAWTSKEAVAKLNGHGVGSEHTRALECQVPFSLDSFELGIDGRNLVGSVAHAV